ncbi:MAG: (2Fe-2S)-binding protein [Phycisphaerae bacterium]|nr:(2Fe-2S)-binding protein [Phycisphaerae bacterium]
MYVTRCVCHNVTFRRLIDLQRQTGASIEELRRTTGCGTNCGMCSPYIALALRTGRAAILAGEVGSAGTNATSDAVRGGATYGRRLT